MPVGLSHPPTPGPPRGATLRRLLVLLRPELPALGRAAALALLVAVLALAAPLLTRALFDRVHPSGNASLLALLVAGLLAAEAAQGAVTALSGFAAFGARARLRDLARLGLLAHVLHLPARAIEAKGSGEVAQRSADFRQAADTAAETAYVALTQGAYLALVPPVLLALEPRLAAVALVSVPLTALLTAALGGAASRHWERTADAYDAWARFQVEAVREARTFKAMGLEHALLRRARRAVAVAHTGTVRATALWYGCTGATAVVRALNAAALAYAGWRLVLDGALSVGSYVAFTTYAGLLLAPLRTIIEKGGELQTAAVGLRRAFAYADETPEADPAAAVAALSAPDAPGLASGVPAIAPAERLTGLFRAEGLFFCYSEDPTSGGLVLPLFEAAPGEAVAVVGPSGCGKSTLLRLLARLEAPGAGRLLAEVAGPVRPAWRPVGALPLAAYRRQLAVCWQEPGLLSSSVRDNLLVAAEDFLLAGAPPEEELESHLWAALDACALAARVESLPGGLDTPLAEGAASLSAGERQRLALARTLLRARLAPPAAPVRLVLLDEATANLDAETAATVVARSLDALRRRPHPPAVILVTHRAADARLADRTVSLGGADAPVRDVAGDGLAAPILPPVLLPPGRGAPHPAA